MIEIVTSEQLFIGFMAFIYYSGFFFAKPYVSTAAKVVSLLIALWATALLFPYSWLSDFLSFGSYAL